MKFMELQGHLLILSCLDSVIADFRSSGCAPAGVIHSFLGRSVGSCFNGKKQNNILVSSS